MLICYVMMLNARDFLSHIWNIEIFVLWKGGPEKSLKMGILDHFHPKWLILTKFTPLMTLLTLFMSINLTEIIFKNFYRKNIWPLSLNFGLWRHFGPKWPNFGPFSPKMTYFDQIDPINDTFDPIYVHKSDWNNF